MSDMADIYRDMREGKKRQRAEHGVNCPRCREVRPKCHPSKLMPGQRCKVDGYRDPRPRFSTSEGQ